MPKILNLWTIYQNTTDYPGLFVARRFELDRPTNDTFADKEIEAVRRWVREHASQSGQGVPHRLPRQPEDDPLVVETWI